MKNWLKIFINVNLILIILELIRSILFGNSPHFLIGTDTIIWLFILISIIAGITSTSWINNKEKDGISFLIPLITLVSFIIIWVLRDFLDAMSFGGTGEAITFVLIVVGIIITWIICGILIMVKKIKGPKIERPLNDFEKARKKAIESSKRRLTYGEKVKIFQFKAKKQ